jgi:hypothetical protein
MKKFFCKLVLKTLRKPVKEMYYVTVMQKFQQGMLVDEHKILKKRIPSFEESYHFPSLAIKFITELNEGVPTDFKKYFSPVKVETIGELINTYDPATDPTKLQ